MPSRNPEQLSSEPRPETPQPEGEKAAKPEEEKRFELPDLEEAKEKKYPWAKTAESARKFLSSEITNAEDILEQLTKGVKEDTTLHKQIQKESYFRSKEREKRGEAGTPESDFFAAIEDIKKTTQVKLEMLQQRWGRLVVLSSEKKGAQDEVLNKRAFEKAEGLRKKGKKVDDIECNDKARIEMLKEIKRGITDKETKQELENREKERVANLKTELARVHHEIEGIIETPVKGEEKEAKEKLAKELYEKAKEMAKSLTGENLEEKIKVEAKKELKQEGCRIITKKEYYGEENVRRVEQRTKQRRWWFGIKEAWTDLSDEERQQHGDVKKFAEQLEKQREELAQKLAKQGITLSRDVFYELLRAGSNPQDIKIKGWFSKKIVMPVNIPGFHVKMKIKDFQLLTEKIQKKFDVLVKEEAKTEMDRVWSDARKRYSRRKYRILGKTINEIASTAG